ncbi:hypothetical protein XENOCAPTIV_007608 [Xenoophorus captivus]|uniref:Rubicon PI3K-binding domain-containing protein n=1 Tax=Xenoophorus captivus TaxID=1517983 RepID=A0ABV0SCB0_9TELE
MGVYYFHSTDSGGSRRSSQDSYQGLSDSGSADEVEECELQGTERELDRKNADIKRSVSSSGRSFLSSESIIMRTCSQSGKAFQNFDLVVYQLLPIPNSLPISPDDGEHADIYKLRIRVRGNLERKVIVAKQNFRCAGCGTRIDPGITCSHSNANA